MVKIVTDSTAYLTDDEIKKYGINVVPLHIQFDNESFAEGTYSNTKFYKKLRENPNLFPSTSQPPVGEFVELYKKIATTDDEIISIHLSGGISGTVKSAQSAALLLPTYNIHVVDSLTSVAGQGLIVKEAAYFAKQGKNKAQILEIIEYLKKNLITLFMVDDLEYLKRGGRIGGAAALLGTLLQVKPILTINDQISVYQKVRTKQKAFTIMIDTLGKAINANSISNIKVVVMNVDAADEANKIADLIFRKYPGLEIEHCDIGPVIGAHVGPGAIGLSFTPSFLAKAE